MNLGSAVDAGFQPITNWSLCPAFEVDFTSTTFFASLGSSQATTTVSADTVDRPLPFGRSRVTTLTSNGNWGRRWIPGGNSNGAAPIRLGHTLSFGFWIKVSQDCTIRPLIEYSDSVGGYIGGSGTSLAAENLVAGVWTYVARSFVCPNPSAALWRTYGFTTPNSGLAGFEFKLGPNMGVVNATLPEVFSDGNTPGWKWLGTPGLSTSVGHPYALSSIAGQPLADRTTPGSTTIGLPASTGPITLYLAGNRLTETAAWADGHGINASGTGFSQPNGFSIAQRGSSSSWGWQSRHDTATSGSGFNQHTPRTLPGAGVHVFAASLNNGMTQANNWLNGTALAPLASTPGDGIALSTLTMQGASSSFTPLRLLVYRAEHNNTTAAQISAWLARKYGGTIPSGY